MEVTLSKSKRVKVIKDIAAHMSLESWTTLDLTLSQFSLPTSPQWSGDQESYVDDKIQDASDGLLAELAEHFGMDGFTGDDAVSNAPDPPFWAEGKLKVFLSHLTTQREQASGIKDCLGRYGMGAFVAHADIEPTLEWQIEIESALSTCDLLVAVLHPGFLESKWCDQEIGYALGRGVPVFTIRCGLDPYGFVSRFQGFNGHNKTPVQISRELFDAAVVHKKLQAKMSHILIDQFVNSGSYAAARDRIDYLENITAWDDSFTKRIKDAVKNNSQVSGAFGVADRVKSLVAKWKAA